MNTTALRWRALWNPDMYHGWGRDKSYFEGWYFKVVSADEKRVFAFIPGISMSDSGEKHAFIQVLDGVKRSSVYHRFDAEDLIPSTQGFRLKLGQNEFSDGGIRLDLPEIKGKLTFNGLYRWPKMLGAPGIMGWYSFVPFMECYHGVLSMDHEVSGKLVVDNETISFEGGKGYMEKDWGRSFPSAWIWLQTNHFGKRRTSLMASCANIPWLRSSFVGHIVGFLLDDKLHRFATYTGSKMTTTLHEDYAVLVFEQSNKRLEIKANKAAGTDLVAPIEGAMAGKVNESMQAVIDVRFFEHDKLVFEGRGKNAGLELAGDVGSLTA